MDNSQDQFVNDARTTLNNQSAQIRDLEMQMGQMSSLLNEKQQGTLPSASEVNPKGGGMEHYSAIILRSGKDLEGPIKLKLWTMS